MATVTIRAADAAQALDEVMRCLGPDALILSTRQHKGQVEVVAAPSGGPVQPQAEPPVVSGFSGHLLRQLARSPVQSGVLPPHLPGRVILAGPPGSGRSTLAARLAAEALRTPGAARPVLIAPRPDLLTAPGRLSSCARLLGLVPHRPVWRSGEPVALPSPAVDETQIIDLSDLPQAEPSLLSGIAARADTALWLVLPTGLHPGLLDRLCQRFADLATHVVLTRTDLCAPTSDDLQTPRRHGLPVSLLAGGGALLDALSAVPVPPAFDAVAEDAVLHPQPQEMPDAAARLS
jgi:hypothetical protein